MQYAIHKGSRPARFQVKMFEIVLPGVSFRSVGSGVHDGVI